MHNKSRIAAVAAFARGPNAGLIVLGGTLANVHRDLIITLAARHRPPAVYHGRYLVAGGGRFSYGPDLVVQYRLAGRRPSSRGDAEIEQVKRVCLLW